MSNISDNIKRYRCQADLTQQELADRLNIKRYYISDWESARTEPNIDTLILLAKFFDVTIDELVGEENRTI